MSATTSLCCGSVQRFVGVSEFEFFGSVRMFVWLRDTCLLWFGVLTGLRDTSLLVGLSEHEFVLWFGSELGGFA